MSVKSLDSVSEWNTAIHLEGLVVIDFWADWCSPCKQIAPKVKELAVEYPHVSFYKIDVEDVTKVSEAEGISAMPTFLFYKNGVVIDKVVGANLLQLKSKVAQHQ